LLILGLFYIVVELLELGKKIEGLELEQKEIRRSRGKLHDEQEDKLVALFGNSSMPQVFEIITIMPPSSIGF
jgi:hypothetical protein